MYVLLFQMLASASGSCGLTNSQLCFWDINDQICRKVVNHHEHDVVCLAYSRDDRFLISVGKSITLNLKPVFETHSEKVTHLESYCFILSY